MGRFHLLRVLVLIFAVGLLSWYARQGGNNPFAGTKTIRIASGENGYAIMCSAGKTPAKRIVTLFAPEKLSSSDIKLLMEDVTGEWNLITLCQTIDFNAFPNPPQSWTILSPQTTMIPVDNTEIPAEDAEASAINTEDSAEAYDNWPEPFFNTQAGAAGRFFWQIVYPLGDSVHAVLLTVDKTATLICGSSVLSGSSKNTRSQFKEKLDLLIIPSADAKTVMETREIFRPRFIAVIPPCDTSAKTHLKNIICADDSKNWEYKFKAKRGKLSF